MKELVRCKHETAIQLLYECHEVLKVEDNLEKCAVLKNTRKVHIAACHDGKTFATVVCRLGRQGTKGKCWSCKGARCGHENQWNKELKASVLKNNVEKGYSTKETSSSSDNDDDEDFVTGLSHENDRIERCQLN